MLIGNFLIIYLIFARLIELRLSHNNTKKLLGLGAKEFFPFHYKFIVLFHAFFLIYFFVNSFFVDDIDFYFLLAFFFIQILRYKTLSDLGEYWTTRIIVLENAPLTNNGIYKYLKHPNYIIVFIEVFLVCLIFYDYLALVFFSSINLFLLIIRIYYEEKANKHRIKHLKS